MSFEHSLTSLTSTISSPTRAGPHGNDYNLRLTTTITAVGDRPLHCGEHASGFGRCDKQLRVGDSGIIYVL